MLKFQKTASVLLALVMLFNLLPIQALGTVKESIPTVQTSDETSLSTAVSPEQAAEPAVIVEELTESRTEYSKAYRLSNGLNMAVVYGEPVHYDDGGKWAEIDNTLKTTAKGGYTNTAGVWDVVLPQQITADSPVTVTKDGRTLSFVLAGQLTAPSGTAVKAAEKTELTTAKTVTAVPKETGIAAAKAEAEYPETVSDKLSAGLMYADVFTGTSVTYDLDSNKLKESVILEAYNATLRGYKYTLHTDGLVPVLNEDGQIDLYNTDKTEIIMTMPAPFLVDAANEYNYDIQVQLTGKDGAYTLTYLLPQTWLADKTRQWPVVLDPVVQPELSTSNILDRTINENGDQAYNGQTLDIGRDPTDGIERAYVQYKDLPELSPSDVIVEAQIKMKVCGGYNAPKVEVHKVPGTWDSKTVSWTDNPGFDPVVEDYSTLASNTQWHQWTITDIVRNWYEGENTGMLFKAIDSAENGTTQKWRQYISSDGGGDSDRPVLTIKFRNNNGLESYWDYTSASAGRAGTGSVNTYTGNLVWTRTDVGVGGNRAPVTISHIYNANDTVTTYPSNSNKAYGGNSLGMGYGWRTNFNQLVYQWGTDGNYYVWEDADGTDHYFYRTSTTGKYLDEDNLNLTLNVISGGYKIIDKNGNNSYFDSQGRFYKYENNQTIQSTIQITYATGNQIDYILDGVNRKYDFTYTNGLLTRIGYYGNGTTELAYVAYAYDGNEDLVSITDMDGKSSSYTYTGHLLKTAEDIDGYKLTYTYTKTEEGKPSRIKTVSESHNEAAGGSLTLTYAHNQTTFEDHNGNKQIIQFNDWGNTVSVQDGLGRAQHAAYANMAMTDTGKANQLKLSSKLQNTVKNYISHHSIEMGSIVTSGAAQSTTEAAYMGEMSLKTTSTVSNQTYSVAVGESYTFSAWVKTDNTTAKLTLLDAQSTVLKANSEWTRLEVTYTNNTDGPKDVIPQLVTANNGNYAYMDCIQLEKTAAASRYNLINNGDFTNGMTGWTGSNYAITTAASGAPQLDNNMVTVTGDPAAKRQLTQTVAVGGAAGDCFVLAGWAQGNSVPLKGSRAFGIIGTFNYTDGTTEDFTASFNADTRTTVITNNNDGTYTLDDTVAWQYTAAPMVATKAYNSITVKLAYDYNANAASFDGIQLFKEVYGCSYTHNDKGEIVSSTDLQDQTTTYEYNTSGDLTKVILASGAEMTYTYDSHHNVLTSTSTEGLSYTFTYDDYGNNTKVSTTSDGLTMSAEVEYTTDGNYQRISTDALGNETTYSYNSQTGVLEWVKGPTDTDATRTNYTYDQLYRIATETMTTDSGLSMSVGYTYENDYLTAITTPTTTYGFTYGDFGLNEKVTVGERTLVTRSYTDDQNKYLEKLDFGNGDRIQYNYDSYGRLLAETYEDGDTVSYYYDNDGALVAVHDSDSGITARQYYDLTGRNVGYSETGEDLNHRVIYEYNNKNNLAQTVETIGTDEKLTSYTYDDDNRVTSITTNGTTVEYTYDAFGRVTQQVTKIKGENEETPDTVILTEYFTYTAPTATTTSGQVATYRTVGGSYDITYSYTYDTNGNITSVYDGSIWIYYAYDSANQLIREDNQDRGRTYTWTYDNAGNILSFNTYAYTRGALGTALDTVAYGYGDEDWGDLMTSYDGTAVTYDEIGNPETLNGRTYVWEHGRQLKSMTKDGVTWTYTYNNAGLRTGRVGTKTVNGETVTTDTYEYIYNGSQLVRMIKNGEIVDITYDAAGTPLTMTYDEVTYYYITNLQGDVVGLLDGSGNKMISYRYTAYGQCFIFSDESPMTMTLANMNPLGYRGYVMDVGTFLYYCQSRYYDQTVGRFINADGLVSTGQGLLGNNMFAYCGNNPVNRADPTGYCPRWLEELWEIIKKAVGADDDGVVKYDVPLYNQGDTNLCWAYCQLMIEDYKNNIKRTKIDADYHAKCIAIKKHGKDNWDNPSRPTNRVAIQIQSIKGLYLALEMYGPLYAAYGYYENGERKGGHAVVITGVDLNRGIVYTNDPAGTKGVQSYSQFLDYLAGSDDDKWDFDTCFYLYLI